MKYSASTNGFYDPLVNENIPTDAVEVSEQNYQELLEGQSQGKVIAPNADGHPVLVDPAEPTLEQKLASCKKQAKLKLAATDYSQTNDVAQDLLNVQEFVEYRAKIRAIFFNPSPTPVWPDEPVAVWKE